MLFTSYRYAWDRTKYTQIFTYILKTGPVARACFWDGCMSFVFAILSIVLLDFEGPSFAPYSLMGLFYILTLGRRGLWSGHRFFSVAMIPCFIPSFLFCVLLLPPFISSDALAILGCGLWIALSRWPLWLKPFHGEVSKRNLICKTVMFVALQGLYGSGLQFYGPSLLEPLEWQATGLALKPKHRYLSETAIHFFYDDKDEADKIEAQLPKIVEILKHSPFYKNAEDLILVQKHSFQLTGLSLAQQAYVGGCHYIPKQYSYYFTSFNEMDTPDPIYYSHNNAYRAVVLHELTHQMVNRYYGKWWTGLSVETWKDEGYAEYMAGTECYGTKAELLAIIKEHALSDHKLQNPFSDIKSWKYYSVSDYMAAFLQVRYALDFKKISPLKLFKKTCTLASAQEIKEWLMQDDTIVHPLDDAVK